MILFANSLDIFGTVSMHGQAISNTAIMIKFAVCGRRLGGGGGWWWSLNRQRYSAASNDVMYIIAWINVT